MGRKSGKRKNKQGAVKTGDRNVKGNKVGNTSPKACQEDADAFISVARELKDEGNKLFQNRDYVGAISKYEKAIKLLPENHIDVSYFRSNMAACFMQMGISEYPKAIHQCNLALEVTPRYSKALLKRARCYENLNRLDFALRDINLVLESEPSNVMAAEIEERLRDKIENGDSEEEDDDDSSIPDELVPEYVEPPSPSPSPKLLKEKMRKLRNKIFRRKGFEDENVEKSDGESATSECEDLMDEEKANIYSEDRKAEELANEEKPESNFEEKKAEEIKLKDEDTREKCDEKKASEEKLVDKQNFDKRLKQRAERIIKLKRVERTLKKANIRFEDKKEEEEAVEKIPETKFMEKKPEEDSELKKIDENKIQKKSNWKKAKIKVQDKKAEAITGEKEAETKSEKKEEADNEPKQVDEKKVKEESGEKKAKLGSVIRKFEEKIDELKPQDKFKKAEDIVKWKKGNQKMEGDYARKHQKIDEMKDREGIEERNAEDKLVVEEKITKSTEEERKKHVKLVYGEDIRWVQMPSNCSILNLREIISDRFPKSKAVVIRFRDHEGDLVTITTNEELRWAEVVMEKQGSVRFQIFEVSPEEDPFYDMLKYGKIGKCKKAADKTPSSIDDWIIQFAQLFKNYVGFSSDAYLDLNELGLKFYSEAMEEAVTGEEAQKLFKAAADKFQEMGALALFNWGNVHMSRARKRVYFNDDSSKEAVLEQVRSAYDWTQTEYSEAGKRYEETLRIKPDFYEGVLALAQQQFEKAKLSWYYAVATTKDLNAWPTSDIFQLYNYAEDNMEKGIQMWEEAERQRLNKSSEPSKVQRLIRKMGLDGICKDVSDGEAAEQAANMRSQINLLWGTILYERSVMEFKLGLPVWQECLEVAVEKFEHAGAAYSDLAVMIKNHCANNNALEGVGFNIDEIIQAWNEMHEAKRWTTDVPSFRLEPLLRRRVSKLYNVLEVASDLVFLF